MQRPRPWPGGQVAGGPAPHRQARPVTLGTCPVPGPGSRGGEGRRAGLRDPTKAPGVGDAPGGDMWGGRHVCELTCSSPRVPGPAQRFASSHEISFQRSVRSLVNASINGSVKCRARWLFSSQHVGRSFGCGCRAGDPVSQMILHPGWGSRAWLSPAGATAGKEAAVSYRGIRDAGRVPRALCLSIPWLGATGQTRGQQGHKLEGA